VTPHLLRVRFQLRMVRCLRKKLRFGLALRVRFSCLSMANRPGTRFIKYLTISHKIIYRKIDLQQCVITCQKFSWKYRQLIYEHYLERSYDTASELWARKYCVLCEMFDKLDVLHKSIVFLSLSQDYRRTVVRYFVNRAPRL